MLEWIAHLGSQGPYWCSLEPYRRLELLILPGTTGTQEICWAARASRFQVEMKVRVHRILQVAYCHRSCLGSLELVGSRMTYGPGAMNTIGGCWSPSVLGWIKDLGSQEPTWSLASLGLLELIGAGETKEWVPRRL